ncbi:MAG: DUF177 domain-containing protein [Ignavibacteria bacterium]|jgi:hypothetical protein|nr:DUF177 domain-containing protein [Ignavibacteria bacterium]
MMQIRIHGIKDGKHPIDLRTLASSVPDIFPEFIGEIHLEGVLTKLGNRYNFSGTATCMARYVCDLSLEEYEEEVVSAIDCSMIADTELYFLQQTSFGEEFNEIALHSEDEYFDISAEVKDSLVVHLPMRRIAPQYRGKSWQEIHPELVSNNKMDDRWSGLQGITFDN